MLTKNFARLPRRGIIALTVAFLLAVSAVPLAAATDEPIVDLQFNGNHDDSAGGTSSIEVFGACEDPIPAAPDDLCNDVSTFGSDSTGSYWRWESSNPRGGGFRLVTTEELGETFTVGLRFSFDEVGLGDDASSWRKIIDYKNRVDDTGFYFYESLIEFYDLGTSTESYAAGEVIDLLAVRSGTEGSLEGQFIVYVIGSDGTLTEVLNVSDTAGESIPAPGPGGGSLLGFFFDDTSTSSEGTPGGQVYSVRIWDRALEPTELDEALDEPPVEEPPAEEPPAEEPPAEDPPAEDPPAEDEAEVDDVAEPATPVEAEPTYTG